MDMSMMCPQLTTLLRNDPTTGIVKVHVVLLGRHIILRSHMVARGDNRAICEGAHEVRVLELRLAKGLHLSVTAPSAAEIAHVES